MKAINSPSGHLCTKILALALIYTLSGLSGNRAFALPSYKKSPVTEAILREIGDDAAVGGLFVDSEDPSQIYVLPGDKNIQGRFSQVNGSTIECGNLANLRNSTFRVPKENEVQFYLDKDEFVSPAFQATIALNYLNKNLKNEQKALEAKLLQASENMKDRHGEYLASAKNLEDIKIRKDEIRAEMDGIADKAKKEIEFLKSSGLNSPEELKRVLDEMKSKRKELANILKDLNSKEQKAQQEYSKSLKEYGPLKDSIEQAKLMSKRLSESMDRNISEASEALKRNRELIESLEDKTIGSASAAFSVNANLTLSKVRAAIKKIYEENENPSLSRQFANINVHQIPIYDAELNTSFHYTPAGYRHDGDSEQVSSYIPRMFQLPSNAKLTTENQNHFSEKKISAPVGEIEDENGNITTTYLLAGNFGRNSAQSIGMTTPVNVGAFCGYPKIKKIERNYKDSVGNPVTHNLDTYDYEHPPKGQPVLALELPVTYKYFVAADMKAKCELDMKKTASYWRSSGSKSGWRGFSRYKRTWDDSKRSMAESMGIKCTEMTVPTGATDQERLAAEARVKDRAYDEIFKLYLMHYGKDVKVEVTDPGKPDTGKDSGLKGLKNLGLAALSMCAKSNLICKVTSFAIKDLDSIMGSRTHGRTSDSASHTGHFRQEFDFKGYNLEHGSSVYRIRACVNPEDCEAIPQES